ncbi:hypothetical protein FRC08_014467 [Ceratobasidium sp. 394]|nr:hypothetical protein FRC08_014467 [Ceratobasidium sp. 394]
MCHYIVNLWERWSQMVDPLQPIARSMFKAFLTSIPKFHLARHTEQCFDHFSLNHMFGVGRMDAEGGKQCWANLNHAAGSTKERGPGSHMDTLNHTMQQWNWVKTVQLAEHILKKWKEATVMANQQEAAWMEFDQSVDGSLTAHWRTLSTEPLRVNGK